MADLNEVVKTVTRKSWDRCGKFRGENVYKQTPKLRFEVETATTDDDVLTGTTPKGLIDVAFDPTEVYPLLNPLDDSVISPDGGNHFMLQVHLYSLFKFKAQG